MVTLAAGELRDRLTARRWVEVSDGHDGFDVSPVVVFSRVAGRVRPLQGRDLERARQVDPRISSEVTFRYWSAYRTDLAGGRVELLLHQGASIAEDRVLEIVGAPIDVEEAHVKVQLFCREAA